MKKIIYASILTAFGLMFSGQTYATRRASIDSSREYQNQSQQQVKKPRIQKPANKKIDVDKFLSDILSRYKQFVNHNGGVVEKKSDSKLVLAKYSIFGDKKLFEYKETPQTKFYKFENGKIVKATSKDVKVSSRVYVVAQKQNLDSKEKAEIKKIKESYKSKIKEAQKISDLKTRWESLQKIFTSINSEIEAVYKPMTLRTVTIVPESVSIQQS